MTNQTNTRTAAASIMGSARTPAKSAASRENGTKGGRPRKTGLSPARLIDVLVAHIDKAERLGQPWLDWESDTLRRNGYEVVTDYDLSLRSAPTYSGDIYIGSLAKDGTIVIDVWQIEFSRAYTLRK